MPIASIRPVVQQYCRVSRRRGILAHQSLAQGWPKPIRRASRSSACNKVRLAPEGPPSRDYVEEAADRVIARTQTGEAHAGSALIGADGSWSTIRQRTVGDGKPGVAGNITCRALLPAANMPPDLRWW